MKLLNKTAVKTILIAVLMLAATACGRNYEPVVTYPGYGIPAIAFQPATDISGTNLTVYTTFATHFAEPIIAAFEEITGARVDVVFGGTGELLDRLAEEADNPQADVFWGASMFTVRPHTYLFEDYISVNEPYVMENQRNVEGPFTRIHTSGRLLIVNTDRLEELGIEVTGYGSLLQPELRGLIAIADPAASASAFNHMVNQLYAMGNGNPHDGWDYMRAFIDNTDGIMLSSSSAVINGVVSGDFAVGLTFEEAPWALIRDGEPVAAVYISEGIVATSNAAAVVAGASNRYAARVFIDFITSYDNQMRMESLYRRTVRADIAGQGILPGNDELVWIPFCIDYVLENREDWLEKFANMWDEVTN